MRSEKVLVRLICKCTQWLLKKVGRGTSFPGRLALRLDRDFLGGFQKPELLIFVTGTVGKTTTAAMITEALKKAGYKVASNGKGSNLLAGVCSLFAESCSIGGRPKVKAMVVEIDERYVKTVLPYMTPDYFLINNIARDQSARNGHFDIVFHDICDYMDERPHLILNADNPMSYRCSIGRKNKVTYFGLAENSLSAQFSNEKQDVAYCPVCSCRIAYDYFNFGNFGGYHCTGCDFRRQMPEFEAVLTDRGITIDGKDISMAQGALYNAYNMAAAYTVARLAGADGAVIAKALEGVTFSARRFQQFSTGEVEGTLLLSKNETPASYTQSLEYISRCSGDKTVAIGFNRISGRYDEKDISWLYDIRFELLAEDMYVEEIILIGPFAYDLAVRMKVAGIHEDRLRPVCDGRKAIDEIEKSGSHVYCVFYFDMYRQLVKEISEKGGRVW